MADPRRTTEAAEQEALFSRIRLAQRDWPELALVFHPPNGGLRRKATAGRLRAQGVVAGVPDVLVPIMRGPFPDPSAPGGFSWCPGLAIELKVKPNRLTDQQAVFLHLLAKQGWETHVCWDWEEAWERLEAYLRLPGARAMREGEAG